MRLRILLVGAAIGGVVLGVWLWPASTRAGHESAKEKTTRSTTNVSQGRSVVSRPVSFRLRAATTGTLATPIQDAAIAAVGGNHAFLLAGLTAADTSSGLIRRIGPASDRTIGSLPGVLHDTAAARLGRDVYLFGGGNGVVQLDQITRIDSAGHSRIVGRLPAPSSDQAGAAIGGTVYIVGGFTGTRWLDTIVAWRPGGRAGGRASSHTSRQRCATRR